MKIKKSNFGGESGFIGNGELTDYRKDGSWIMNQIDKGWQNVRRGITVNNDKDDHIRFSRIASKVMQASKEFKIVKNYKKLEPLSRADYRFALRWSVSGDLNGSTLKDLNVIQELLINELERDYMKMQSALNAKFDFVGEAVVDFNKNVIKIESIISFESDINNDEEKIINFLGKIDFQSIK